MLSIVWEYFLLLRTLDSPPVLGAVVAVYQMVIIFLLPFLVMSSSYYKVKGNAAHTVFKENIKSLSLRWSRLCGSPTERWQTWPTPTRPLGRGRRTMTRCPGSPLRGLWKLITVWYPLRILSTYLQFQNFKIKRSLEFLSKEKIMMIKADVTGASIAKTSHRATRSGSKSHESRSSGCSSSSF